mmetsp:Transcript_25308/g.41862  ORF Transcript_25308/g.41862 Transcript_25308/m.41862 type:complete len:133 (+) Transcript_25308:510-908(+)
MFISGSSSFFDLPFLAPPVFTVWVAFISQVASAAAFRWLGELAGPFFSPPIFNRSACELLPHSPNVALRCCRFDLLKKNPLEDFLPDTPFNCVDPEQHLQDDDKNAQSWTLQSQIATSNTAAERVTPTSIHM